MKLTAFHPANQKTMTTNLQAWAGQSTQRLQGKSEFPYLESQVLLAFTLNTSREWIIAHPEFELTPEYEQLLESHLVQLLKGEPLPYITGVQAFYGLDFFVSPDVLIPRPETELLVEEAIGWLRERPNRRNALDMGTGSGAIAVTLVDQIPDLLMTATDISAKVLEVALKNAEKYGVDERTRFIQSNLWENIPFSFDLIAANLPYIPSDTLVGLQVFLHEPPLALDGGPDGLRVIDAFLERAAEHIKPGGFILLEIEAGQGESAIALVQEKLTRGSIKLITDYSNLPRLITIQVN